MLFTILLILLSFTSLIMACIAYWKVSKISPKSHLPRPPHSFATPPRSFAAPPADTISLRTVNYNVFGRWFGVSGYEGQNERLANIPLAIKNHPKLGPDVDVITIEEAWCPDSQLISPVFTCGNNTSRTALIKAMAENGWIYHTAVVDKPGVSVVVKQTNGGSLIFSKWPILATSQYVYTSAAGQDASAAKGVNYIRIEKTQGGLSQIFNIFGTHLQAWSTKIGRDARYAELTELHDTYLPAIGIPTDGTEVVLYQGDMNTDYVLYPKEVVEMQKILQAKLPDWVPSSQQLYSSDPSTNYLVGKDGAAGADGCLNEYEKQLNMGNGVVPANSVGPTATCAGTLSVPSTTNAGGPINPRFLDPSTGKIKVSTPCNAYCPCCPHEMLDYILYSTEKSYLQPLKSSIEIIPLKSVDQNGKPAPLSYKWGWCDAKSGGGAACIPGDDAGTLTGSDLSDHYPVVANFTFKASNTNYKIDGCKSDSDCHLKDAYCYCRGAQPWPWSPVGPSNCTKDGKNVDGFDGHKHEGVNKNCVGRSSAKGSCFCRPGDQ